MKKLIPSLAAFLLLSLAGPSTSLAQLQPILLPVPVYNQANPAWAKDKLGSSTSVTIGQQGCAVTCYAMMVSYYHQMSFTPGAANRFLRNNGGFSQGTLLNWPVGGRLAGLNYNRRNFRSTQEAISVLATFLAYGKPVTVEVRRNGRQHFVAVVGWNGRDFIANDPDGGRRINLFAKYGTPLGTRALVR
jgi:hypothetical protein